MDFMTNPVITGYRQLSEEEAALINEGKALARLVGDYIIKLRGYPPATDRDGRVLQGVAGTPSIDHCWVSIGATQLQQGFMAVTRGIAQPSTF